MNNKHILFSGTMKLADIILGNYTLLSVLSRFDIHLGFGEKTLAEVCRARGVNENFLLLVCNIHTFDDYFPGSEELKQVDIVSLIGYLEKSHTYYTDNRIASIQKRLDDLEGCCDSAHHRIIRKFFDGYKQEVVNHFDYEEQTAFPYVRRLIEGSDCVDYHIDQYEENHSNIDDKLSDLKNILIKYLPESCGGESRNEILTDIFLFEEDLTKHTRIEDKILIPYVREIEKSHEKQ